MKSIIHRNWVLAIALLFAIAISRPSFAAVINGDFNVTGSPTFSGQAVAPDVVTNTFWNGIIPDTTQHTYTSGALTASDGATATAVTVTIIGSTPSTVIKSFD